MDFANRKKLLLLLLPFILGAVVAFLVSLLNVSLSKKQQPLSNDHNSRKADVILPTPFPTAFRVHFLTNVSRLGDQKQAEKPNDHALHATLYYDWSLRAQRIDHPAGSYECVRFYNVSTHGCILYFLPKGMYRVIVEDGSEDEYNSGSIPGTDINDGGQKLRPDCCLDIPGLGAPPPDWARQGNATFHGRMHDSYSGLDAYEFVFGLKQEGQENDSNDDAYKSLRNTGSHRNNNNRLDLWKRGHGDNKDNYDTKYDQSIADIYDQYHTAREVHEEGSLSNGLPLTFTFPSKAKGLQDYHYDVSSMEVGSQDPGIFQLPKGCENTVCNKPGQDLQSKDKTHSSWS